MDDFLAFLFALQGEHWLPPLIILQCMQREGSWWRTALGSLRQRRVQHGPYTAPASPNRRLQLRPKQQKADRSLQAEGTLLPTGQL